MVELLLRTDLVPNQSVTELLLAIDGQGLLLELAHKGKFTIQSLRFWHPAMHLLCHALRSSSRPCLIDSIAPGSRFVSAGMRGPCDAQCHSWFLTRWPNCNTEILFTVNQASEVCHAQCQYIECEPAHSNRTHCKHTPISVSVLCARAVRQMTSASLAFPLHPFSLICTGSLSKHHCFRPAGQSKHAG